MGEQMEVDDSGPVGNRPLPGSCIMGGLSIRNLVVYTIESMAIGLGHRLPPKKTGSRLSRSSDSDPGTEPDGSPCRSEEHTSELQSLV